MDTSTINLDELMGKTIAEAVKKYGKQTRIDPSEYGFVWYIYNRSSKRYLMLGVKDDIVVAAYCNSKYFLAQNAIKVGVKREAVREKFGVPLTSIRKDNLIYVLPNTDQRDVFLIGDYYVYFFYDVFDGYKVTAVMLVKSEYEEAQIDRPLTLTDKMVTAYTKQSKDLVNAVRARKGLATLKNDAKAAELALYRSKDMLTRNYFSHYTPEGKGPAYFARKMGIHIKVLCENIAKNHRNAISAFESFMNSKGHRSNILAKVKQIGVGTAFGGDHQILLTYILLTTK
jgi:uncharacterized protein YkwD